VWLLAGLLVPAGAAAQEGAEEPEEPDFFFLTGGPYTQKQNSPQIIWVSSGFGAAHLVWKLASLRGPGGLNGA
jgi:hypothetical protein